MLTKDAGKEIKYFGFTYSMNNNIFVSSMQITFEETHIFRFTNSCKDSPIKTCLAD